MLRLCLQNLKSRKKLKLFKIQSKYIFWKQSFKNNTKMSKNINVK